MATEKRAPVLTESKFKQVVAVTRSRENGLRNVALLFFSVALGLRAKGLSRLRERDVTADDGRLREEILLTRTTTKGAKQRLVYLANRDVLKALNAYLRYRTEREGDPIDPGSCLFQSRKRGGFSANTMQACFRRIYTAAGLPLATSHSGRRTFATTLIERGVDIKAVSSLMGHASVSMTAQYVDENPVRLRRICEEFTLGV